MRNDILVSVGVVDEVGPRLTLPRLRGIIGELAAAFRYYELVYVVRESKRAEIAEMADEFLHIPNLRIILATDTTRFYRSRLIAAMEAIGDVVAIYDIDEIPVSALIEQIAQAKLGDGVQIGWHASRPPNGWGHRLLALASNHLVTARAARTIVLSRRGLNVILTRKSASIDLRFEARNASIPYQRFPIAGAPPRSGGFRQRYELLLEILLAGAPRFLKLYALLGFLVMLGAIAYGIYALLVPLVRDKLAEGWLSTALVQAGSTAFIAAGMSILSIALVAIIEMLSGGNAHMIADEISNTDFFDKVTDRNVELSGAVGREREGGA